MLCFNANMLYGEAGFPVVQKNGPCVRVGNILIPCLPDLIPVIGATGRLLKADLVSRNGELQFVPDASCSEALVAFGMDTFCNGWTPAAENILLKDVTGLYWGGSGALRAQDTWILARLRSGDTIGYNEHYNSFFEFLRGIPEYRHYRPMLRFDGTKLCRC